MLLETSTEAISLQGKCAQSSVNAQERMMSLTLLNGLHLHPCMAR